MFGVLSEGMGELACREVDRRKTAIEVVSHVHELMEQFSELVHTIVNYAAMRTKVWM